MVDKRFYLTFPTATLLAEIANYAMKRNDVALTYSICLSPGSSERTNWEAVNAAIVARWSVSALIYIKTRAWMMRE